MTILEHIHVNVSSIAKTRAFLSLAVPDLELRGEGDAAGYGAWIHIGDADHYIALTEVPGTRVPDELRHIGLVVEDVDALMARLKEHGIVPADASSLDTHPHRRRVYYVDDNGLDWEFVEYLSDDAALRNDYSL